MPKTITIPDFGRDPLVIRVNDTFYAYKVGATETVPDEVADLIAAIISNFSTGKRAVAALAPLQRTDDMTLPVGADEYGLLFATPPTPYTLPKATASVLGGVKAAAKTDAMTEEVGVSSAGKLYVQPYALPAASEGAIGGVMLAESVPECTAENIRGCVTSINAVLTALKAAGIMADS